MMEINGLFIVVIVIFVAFMVLGYMRGVLGIIFGVASWVFLFFFVNWAGPQVFDNLKDTQVEKDIATYVYEYLDEKTDDTVTDLNIDLNAGIDTLSDELFDKYGIMIPKELLSSSKDAVEESDVAEVVKEGAEDARASLLLSLTVIVTGAILNGLSIVISVVIGFVICFVVSLLIRIIRKAPMLGEANRAIGVVFGVFEGLLVVWVLMYIVSISAATDFGQQMMQQIDNNMILKFLYDYNQIVIFTNK